MPRPRVQDDRPLSDHPAPPNAYRSGCAPEPAGVARHAPPAAAAVVQANLQTSCRQTSPPLRSSLAHRKNHTPQPTANGKILKRFTSSEVLAALSGEP